MLECDWLKLISAKKKCFYIKRITSSSNYLMLMGQITVQTLDFLNLSHQTPPLISATYGVQKQILYFQKNLYVFFCIVGFLALNEIFDI